MRLSQRVGVGRLDDQDFHFLASVLSVFVVVLEYRLFLVFKAVFVAFNLNLRALDTLKWLLL